MARPICLITGGAGLLGSATARLLVKHGWAVRILDAFLPGGGAHEQNLAGIDHLDSLRTGDVRDEDLVRSLVAGCSGVFHAAAHTSHMGSMLEPAMDLSINLVGTAVVLEATRKLAPSAAFVLASSRQVYGKPQFLPVPEEHPLNPPDVNGIGKRAAEDLALLCHKTHGLHCSILRFTNIYGPGLRVKASGLV